MDPIEHTQDQFSPAEASEAASDDFDAEISDLRPATRGTSWHVAVWSAAPLTGTRLSRGQRTARATSAAIVVLLALVAVFASATRGRTGQPSQTAGLTEPALRLQQDGLGCLVDAEWAPDGRRLAMIGLQQDCLQNGPGDYIITLFDTATGKVITRLRPDTPVLAGLRALLPTAATRGDGPEAPVLYYRAVLWSHDGRRLALPFLMQLSPQDGSLQVDGVLALDTDGQHPQVLMSIVHSQEDAIEWDLSTGKQIDAVVGRPSAFAFESVTPAMRYSWGWGGTILPDGLLDAAAAPASIAGPIGDPMGGDTFTLWQPGGVSRQTESDGTHAYHIYTWGVTFAAWSPDGRYLLDSVSEIERLPLGGEPAPSVAALANIGAAAMPLAPVRDAALRNVLLSLMHDTPGPGPQVAWRPDGRVLAVYGIGPNLSLYDCATGALLASLPPGATPRGTPATGAVDLLRWSPDGSRLLLVGPSLNTISIWGPGQLPAR